ncbi:MAG: 5-formyltetrahydrofolate cyclo-ligase [Proteobacteria bacterium]|nr:5-formyltetrahydrofolate cyclo-ligase [Pseudomonadota bacterium]
MGDCRGRFETCPEFGQNSSLITDRLYRMSRVQDACSWFVYVSFLSEVETYSLLRMLLADGRQVSVPCVDRSSLVMSASRLTSIEHDLAPGCFGIPEPAAGCLRPVGSRTIDVVIVPGAAFAVDGFRLGYGGGYYDRFLKNCPAVTIGLAFDMQVVDRVPHDVQRDVPLDYIVTEKRLIHCSSAGRG